MDSSCANPGQGSRTSPSLRRHIANQSRSMGASRRLGASGRPGATSGRDVAMEPPPPSWSPDVEPLDENVLSRVRALVADPPTRYFDERHDRPGSEHLERAVQVQLLRSLAAAPACEVTDRNHALALGMRQRLLGEGATSYLSNPCAIHPCAGHVLALTWPSSCSVAGCRSPPRYQQSTRPRAHRPLGCGSARRPAAAAACSSC